MNTKIIALTTTLLCISSNIFAASANDQGKNFAKDMLNSNLKNISNSVNVNQIPNYSSNVPEKNLTQEQIETKAYEKLATDKASKSNTDMLLNRQTYKIDRDNDPLMKNYNNIEKSASDLIASNYSGCTNIKYGADSEIGNTTKSCTVKVKLTNQFKCTATYQSQCMNPKAGIPNTMIGSDIKIISQQANVLSFMDNGNGNFFFKSPNRKTGCSWFIDSIQFEAKDQKSIKQLILSQLNYDDGVIIELNGNQVFSAIGKSINPTTQPSKWKCEQGKTWSYTTPIDLSSKTIKGINTLTIRNLVADVGNVSFNLKIDRVEPCDLQESFKRTCDTQGANPSNAILLGKVCKENVINKEGVSVCGAYEESYKTLGNQLQIESEDNACSTIRNSGCYESKTECVQYFGGVCIEKRKNFSCNQTSATKNVSVCGSQLICPDGNCTADIGQTQENGTDDFKEAATKLETAGQLVKEITIDKLSIFKGDGRKCKDEILGFSNCCKDSGWGLDVGLAQCTSDEKEIGLAKQTARSHYVGSYSTGTLITTKHKSYCTFPSKLSRIIVEQGRKQIGKSWGSAKNPDCSGFTLQQIESLDFNKMDLSEFYSDVLKKAQNGTTPNSSNAEQQIKESLKNRFGGIN